MTSLREQLAALEHARWSHWMRYQFGEGQLNFDGSWTMPAEKFAHWTRQMFTPYEALTETEKDNDRVEADRTLAVLEYATANPGATIIVDIEEE